MTNTQEPPRMPDITEDDPRARKLPRGRINWGQVFRDLNEEQDRTVLGWVRLQHKVSDADRLRPGAIAKRLDVSSDLLDVRYEPTGPGSESWNEHCVNEISSRRIAQKNARQKKHLGNLWGWDTWVRWTRPETLTREQVLKVENVQIRRDKNTLYAAEDYDTYVRPREEHKALVATLSPYERDVLFLEEDIAELAPHLRMPVIRQLHALRSAREVAYRKNQRMGEDGLKEWQYETARQKYLASKRGARR